MPLAKKTSPLPNDFLNQISTNFGGEQAIENTPEPLKTNLDAQKPSRTKKDKYSDAVNISLSQGKRTKFKLFFTEHELHMTQGFEMAVEYLINEVNEGRLSLSKSGIAKV